MQAKELLRKALEMMNNEGDHWVQDAYRSSTPKEDGRYAYCSMGAIRAVANGAAFPFMEADSPSLLDPVGGNHPASEAYHGAKDALARVIPDKRPDDQKAVLPEPTTFDLITTWNDHPDTEWDEVVERFEAAIAEAP